MTIPTPNAEELRQLCEKLGADELTNEDWIIIAACISSIAMLQMLLESGTTVSPFEVIDDGRPNSVIEAILTVEVEGKP